MLEIGGGTSAEGASVERRRREDRGAEGAEWGRV